MSDYDSLEEAPSELDLKRRREANGNISGIRLSAPITHGGNGQLVYVGHDPRMERALVGIGLAEDLHPSEPI